MEITKLDINDVVQRNIQLLQYVIEEYGLKVSLKELYEFESIYITYSKIDNNVGFRVMAKKYLNGKQYNTNLYNFLTRKIAHSSREKVITTRADFMKFECAWKQLRSLNQVNLLEDEFHDIDGAVVKE